MVPAEHALIRHVVHRRVVMALPETVVERRSDLIATWIAPGTPIAFPDGLKDGRLVSLEQWKIEPRAWIGAGRLELTPWGRRHSIRLFWKQDGSLEGWYVNLQAPLRESPLGFDTMDWQLDLWIEPDGMVHWKDEDHLEQAVELGILTEVEAAAARSEAERVLEEWPFPTGWEDFRPDPGWEAPGLPAGWDVV